jgi:hypothetical protein
MKGPLMAESPILQYVPPMASKEVPNPYFENLPTEETLVELASKHLQSSDALSALVSESAGLPSLREQAVLDGDIRALTEVISRAAALAIEIPLANVKAARANVDLWSARHAVAKTNREKTAQRAYDTGPAHVNGYPEGVQANLDATAIYENWQLQTRETFIALGTAKRNLESAIAAAREVNHG